MPTLTLKDGNGNTVTMPTSADGATYHVIEQGGTAVGSSNALFVTDTAAEASVAATAAAAGTVADTAFVGTGTASIIAALKGVYAKLAGTLTVTDTAAEASLATVATETTAIATASGTTADAAYAGSGSSSVIAALKGVYAAIKGTLTVSWSGQSVALSAGSSVIGAVTMAGDVGTDRSINAPSGPGSATTLTYNGNTLTQLVSIASNTSRKSLEVNNTTGALVVLVFDDGANTAGTVSLLPLAAGTAQYQQGGDFQSQTEQGRVRIFGTTGTFCYAREN
jgi:hypothetical protein